MVLGRIAKYGIIGCTLVTAVCFMQFNTWNVHTILSQSMEPQVPLGTLIVVKTVNPREYQVNNVITFRVPSRPGVLVTHRITAIGAATPTEPVQIYTKGDANTNGDPWVLSPGNIQGKVVLAIPYVGYVISYAHTLHGFVVFALISFLGVVLPCVRAQFRRGGALQLNHYEAL